MTSLLNVAAANIQVEPEVKFSRCEYVTMKAVLHKGAML